MDILTLMTFGSPNDRSRPIPLLELTGVIFLIATGIAIRGLYPSFVHITEVRAGMAVVIFIFALVVLLWLFAHTVATLLLTFFLSFFPRRKTSGSKAARPAMAFLLCTRDDWDVNVAESCLSAMGEDDHLYICDDSEGELYRKSVDQFARNHPKTCSVIRRGTLKGWKAGNLNYCLNRLPAQFAYFMVIDHDNYITREMVELGIEHLSRNPRVAFVQFPSEERQESLTSFQQDMASSVRTVWRLLSLRAYGGFPFTVGHMAIFRRETAALVGAFPEHILTEDLAISMRLANAGYSGAYILSSIGQESVPESYRRYRARYVRWCVGTIQCWLDKKTRLTLRKAPVRNFIDACTLSGALLYPLSVCILLASLWCLPPECLRGMISVGRPFRILTLLSLLLPSLPVVCPGRKGDDLLRYAAVNMAVFFSLIIPISVSLLRIALSQRIEFQNTGNRLYSDQPLFRQSFRAVFSANGMGTIAVELLVFGLILAGLNRDAPLQCVFLAGLACGPIFACFRWDSWIVRLAKYVPLLTLLVTGAVWVML